VIPEGIQIKVPWKVIDSALYQKPGFHAAELAREVCCGHILFGAKVEAVALRVDRDDVLFEVQFAGMPLAVVHLTWRTESNPSRPTTKLFESWDHWVREEMIPAHERYSR
jgi:hypothetical protein